MKVLVLGNEDRIHKFLPGDIPEAAAAEITRLPIDSTPEEVVRAAGDADIAVVDAITPFTRYEIEHMPNLKLIHSEGVAYNCIDTACAAEHGIRVCNQRGANAVAVAEHTVMLMLALVKSLIPGYQNVMAGKQIETKEFLMLSGIHEMSELRIGLYGFGAIARETARLLVPFGPEVVYFQRHRASPETETKYHVSFVTRDELLSGSDILSIHVPVTEETRGMCGAEFFGEMKAGAYFINTARGEIVDNDALVHALLSGKLIGAGLDTLAPEPVQKDNPLLNLPPEIQRRVIVTPHIGGVTSGFFRRAHRTIWENVHRIANGEEPVNQVR